MVLKMTFWSMACRRMFEMMGELERVYPGEPALMSPFQGLSIVRKQIAWGAKRMDDAWFALEAMHQEVCCEEQTVISVTFA